MSATHPAPTLPLRLLLATLALLLTLAPARALDVKEITTPKGFKVWFAEDHTVPIIAVNYAFRGGAAADPKGKRGLASFLSAMLDEGAGTLDAKAFQEKMEELAFSMSHSAGQDWFSGSFRTLSRNREESFRMLALAINRPRFDLKPLARIRRQLLVGLKSRQSDPDQQAWKAFRKALFGDHPYALLADGDEKGISSITASDLRNLHKRLFALDNLIITAAGDISPEELGKLIDDVFATLPEKSAMPEVPPPVMPKTAREVVVKKAIPQTIILMGHDGLLRDDPDFIPAYVVNHILGGGGFGSRLMEEVREKKGLAYSVYSAMFAYRKAGVFFAQASTVNTRARKALGLMKQEIERVAREGVTERELEEAKKYLVGSWPLRFDSTTKIASVLLGLRRQGLGIDYINKRNDLMRAVTLQDARRAARRLLHPDRLQVILYGAPDGTAPTGQDSDGKGMAGRNPPRKGATTNSPTPAKASGG